MRWHDLLCLLQGVCQETDRQVLLVLSDTTYQVKEVLDPGPGEGEGMLGFVVYRDDPQSARRTGQTALVFVPPDRVERVLVQEQGGTGIGFES